MLGNGKDKTHFIYHTERTGGSILRTALCESAPKNGRTFIWSILSGSTLFQYLTTNRIIPGNGLILAVHGILDLPHELEFHNWTFLIREPVSQAWSRYLHAVNHAGYPHPAKEFLSSTPDNIMLRRIAGTPPGKPVGEDDLERGIRRVCSAGFVLQYENYEQDVSRLYNILFGDDWARGTVLPEIKRTKTTIPEEEKNIIIRRNSLSIEFYNCVQTVLKSLPG